MKFRCRQITIKLISTLLTRNVSKTLSAQNCFSWCNLRFSHLYSTPWLHVERIYV